MMVDSDFSASFRARHPTMDLTAVADRFSKPAERIWMMGEARRTPRGTKLDGSYSDSYFFFKLPSEGALADALSEVLDEVASNKQNFAEFAATGGQFEVYVTYSRAVPGASIPPQLMQRLGELNIALGIDWVR
jgi:hypothetical protein